MYIPNFDFIVINSNFVPETVYTNYSKYSVNLSIAVY